MKEPSASKKSFFITAIIVYSIALLCYGYWDYSYRQQQIMANIDTELYNSAVALKYMLPDDFHDRAVDNQSISIKEDRYIAHKLTKLIRETGFKYSYTIIKQGQKLFFITSDITATPKTKRGTFYFFPYEEADASFINAFNKEEPTYKTVSDRWGKVRTVMVPEKSPGGIKYLACIDYDIGYVDKLLQRNLLRSIATVIFFLLLSVPIILVYVKEHRQYIESIRASEEKYRRTFENSVVGFAHSTPGGRFINVNYAFAKMLKYDSPEELITSIADIATQYYVKPSDRERYEKLLQRDGKVDGYEYQVLCKDGSTRWVSTSTRAYFDDQGNVDHYEGVVSDITERKLAEEAQREIGDRLSQIIMGSPVPTFVIDNNHLITHWNKALENISNVKGKDVIGTNKQWKAFYPNERPVMADLIVDNAGEDEVVKYYTGKLHKSEVIEKAYVAEDFFPDMGNEGRWLFFTAAPLQNSAGNIIGAVETLQDITDNKQSEQSLRESEERFRALVEESPLGISLIGHDGNYKYLNPRFEKMFGYTIDEIPTGRDWFKVAFPDDALRREVIDTWLKDKQETLIGQARPRYYPVKCKNGTRKEIHFRPVTLKNLDQFVIYEDITEKKTLEHQLQQSQKMEAIGTLAGGIAHDFNNILSAIIGYNELLKMDLPKNSIEIDYANQIHKAGTRAKDLVKQILTFSRQAEQEFKPVDVSIIVKEVIKLLRSSIPTTIEIKQNIHSDYLVMGDPTQIHQILMNLCTNASHAMQDKGGLLTIDLQDITLTKDLLSDRVILKPGIYVQFNISDTGHGIPAEHLDRIFDPFFTTKDRGEGTGMGLSVVHGIVESYQGAINVSSEKGKGTAIDIYLPAIERRVEPDILEAEDLQKGTEHILFVDDESALVQMGKSQLEALGYHVSARTNSLEALVLFKTKPDHFDLVITDMTMPQMTGEELAKEIKLVRPDIPIILCTGFSSKITPETAHQFNIDALLMKPIILREIAKVVRQALDKR